MARQFSRVSPRVWGLSLIVVAVLMSVSGFFVPWHITHVIADCSIGGARPTTAPEGHCDVIFSLWAYVFAPQTLIDSLARDIILTTLLTGIGSSALALTILALITWWRPNVRFALTLATIFTTVGLLCTYALHAGYAWFTNLVYVDANPTIHQEIAGWGGALMGISFLLFRIGIGLLQHPPEQRQPLAMPPTGTHLPA